MGDSRRFCLMADFVTRNFPACRVADVAGGRGVLSLHLAEAGFEPTVIDPCKSDLPRKSRRYAARRKFVISRIRKPFRAEMVPRNFDLVIGLHPDQATEEIARVAALNTAGVVLVPCCNFWVGPDSHDGSSSLEDIIRRYWRRTGVEWWETYLPMHGKNLTMVKS